MNLRLKRSELILGLLVHHRVTPPPPPPPSSKKYVGGTHLYNWVRRDKVE